MPNPSVCRTSSVTPNCKSFFHLTFSRNSAGRTLLCHALTLSCYATHFILHAHARVRRALKGRWSKQQGGTRLWRRCDDDGDCRCMAVNNIFPMIVLLPSRLLIIVIIAVVLTAITISISTSRGSILPPSRLAPGTTHYLVRVVIFCPNTETRVQQVC